MKNWIPGSASSAPGAGFIRPPVCPMSPSINYPYREAFGVQLPYTCITGVRYDCTLFVVLCCHRLRYFVNLHSNKYFDATNYKLKGINFIQIIHIFHFIFSFFFVPCTDAERSVAALLWSGFGPWVQAADFGGDHRQIRILGPSRSWSRLFGTGSTYHMSALSSDRWSRPSHHITSGSVQAVSVQIGTHDNFQGPFAWLHHVRILAVQAVDDGVSTS